MAFSTCINAKVKKWLFEIRILEIDKLLEDGLGSQEVSIERQNLMGKIHDMKKLNFSELAQKVKFKWNLKGNENTKFNHGILKKKRRQNSIKGIRVEGEWIIQPSRAKTKIFNFYKKKF